MTAPLDHVVGAVHADVDAVRRARRGPRRRHRLVVLGLGVLTLVALAVNLLLGDYTYTVPDFFAILFGKQVPVATFLLMESKLPRALLALLIGLSLGSAGAIFQTTLRNPLASPDVIGVTAGASAFGVIGVLVLGLQGPAVAACAVVGALATSALVRLVGGRAGGFRLILVGVGVAAALMSVVQHVLARAAIHQAQVALQWLSGSVSNTDWPTVRMLALAMLVLMPLLIIGTKGLRATELGDDTAVGLGESGRRVDQLLVIAVLLVAFATAAAGPVAFVAFMAGPTARALNGGRSTILGAALVGALLVLSADFAGNNLIGDVHMPVGVITGALGAPFLLWLLARGATGGRPG
ncbi:iron complex transport system permease protein [Nocardioides daedukensis]|uniref:Iron complex transport system permease protein n=1 Tax=Nocardioides daedukensis TaxID=634462 RepID=A0A7Y9UP37_9ACTN|nr:iron chelate uptake ABC transporter family permease subunit [Nocardioides daedukensis]NYG59188.1 iron complex transport system permease protein [Nocardioides daedukensis]